MRLPSEKALGNEATICFPEASFDSFQSMMKFLIRRPVVARDETVPSMGSQLSLA